MAWRWVNMVFTRQNVPISPGLTITKVRNLGTKTVQNVENSKIVSQLAPQVWDRFRVHWRLR